MEVKMIKKLEYKQDSEMEREALYAKVNEIIEVMNTWTVDKQKCPSQGYDAWKKKNKISEHPLNEPISRSQENGQDCPHCEGEGIIGMSDPNTGELYTCDFCDGTGKV